MAAERLAEFAADAGILAYATLDEFDGAALAGSVAAPSAGGARRRLWLSGAALAGDFVTTEQGTGLVHIAPSHGEDDFELGARHGLDVPDTVAEDGTYTEAAPGFAGEHVFKAAEPVIEALASGNLLARGRLSTATRTAGAPRRR